METALRLEETWEHDGKAWLQRTPTDEGDRDLVSHQCRVWGFRTLGSTGGGRNMVTVETEAPALRRMLPATATPSSLDKHASPLLYVPPPHRSPSKTAARLPCGTRLAKRMCCPSGRRLPGGHAPRPNLSDAQAVTAGTRIEPARIRHTRPQALGFSAILRDHPGCPARSLNPVGQDQPRRRSLRDATLRVS